ncbi:MAG TPA: hypothetical protein VGM92_08200 [Candidatus Kapabacteria bacterium]|jgi:tetratricopeptide (TPR) repeat protein
MRIILSLVILSLGSVAHTTPIDTAQKLSFRDSVRDHYLKHGAWQYNYFTQPYRDEIDSALKLDPTDAYLWQQRGMPYFKQMKYEVGMPYEDSAVKYDADHWLDYRAFLKCIFQKDYLGALQDFKAAKLLHPNAGVMDHEYAFYEGVCYLQLSRYDSAEQCFQLTLAHDRAHTPSWEHYLHDFYLGITLIEEGGNDSAVRAFDLALQSYPNFSDAKYWKAKALSDLHRTDSILPLLYSAREDLKNGYTINEDNAVYEQYPYQIRLSRVNGWIEAEEEQQAKTN